MVVSVNSNSAALTGLQTLKKVNDEFDEVEQRIATGLDVSASKDNAAIYEVARGLENSSGRLETVLSGLDRGVSVSDVSIVASQSVSDLLTEMRVKAELASLDTVNVTQRDAYNDEFVDLLEQLTRVVESSSFDDVNLLDGSLTAGLSIISDGDGVRAMTLQGHDLSLGGSVVTINPGDDISTAALATRMIGLIDDSFANVSSVMYQLGSDGDALQSYRSYVVANIDVLDEAAGNLVDADLGVESAKLSALEVKQELAIQTINVANNYPRNIMTLMLGIG